MDKPLWTPSPERIAASNVLRFMLHVRRQCDVQVGPNYFSLHDWSLREPQAFWSAVWDFCAVEGERGDSVLADGESDRKSVV